MIVSTLLPDIICYFPILELDDIYAVLPHETLLAINYRCYDYAISNLSSKYYCIEDIKCLDFLININYFNVIPEFISLLILNRNFGHVKASQIYKKNFSEIDNVPLLKEDFYLEVKSDINHPFIIIDKIEKLAFWKKRDHTFNDECSVKSNKAGYIITWKIYYDDVIHNFDDILQIFNTIKRFAITFYNLNSLRLILQ